MDNASLEQVSFENLERHLHDLCVPTYLYTLGGLGSGECVGIEKTADVWAVYYSERGSKNNSKIYTLESDAIADFFGRLNITLASHSGKGLP